jgi:tetratricopeptide (TPR) repeat protein
VVKARGRVSEAQGYFSQGLDVLEKSGKDDPDNSENSAVNYQLLLSLGDVFMEKGDPYQAIESFEHARSISRSSVADQEGHLSRRDLELRLAILLPLVGRSGEAEELIKLEIEYGKQQHGLLTEVVNVWYRWRMAPESVKVSAEALLKKVDPDDPWEKMLAWLLKEFCGQLIPAFEAFQTNRMFDGAGLLAIRIGDRFLQQSDSDLALEYYAKARECWSKLPGDGCGNALSAFREAETNWRLGRNATAAALLDDAKAGLVDCVLSVRREGDRAIQEAFNVVQAGKDEGWPAWDWHYYDDLFKASFFFKRFLDG